MQVKYQAAWMTAFIFGCLALFVFLLCEAPQVLMALLLGALVCFTYGFVKAAMVDAEEKRRKNGD